MFLFISQPIELASSDPFLVVTIVLILLVSIGGGTIFFANSRKRDQAAPELIRVFQIAGASRQVADYIVQEKMQLAAQMYHDEHGVSLKEAREAITEIILKASSPNNLLAAGFPQNAVDKIEQGDKIGAIKAYRDDNKVSLREAKETIEYFIR